MGISTSHCNLNCTTSAVKVAELGRSPPHVEEHEAIIHLMFLRLKGSGGHRDAIHLLEKIYGPDLTDGVRLLVKSIPSAADLESTLWMREIAQAMALSGHSPLEYLGRRHSGCAGHGTVLAAANCLSGGCLLRQMISKSHWWNEFQKLHSKQHCIESTFQKYKSAEGTIAPENVSVALVELFTEKQDLESSPEVPVESSAQIMAKQVQDYVTTIPHLRSSTEYDYVDFTIAVVYKFAEHFVMHQWTDLGALPCFRKN